VTPTNAAPAAAPLDLSLLVGIPPPPPISSPSPPVSPSQAHALGLPEI
jgi:hypothetical protein